MHKLWDVSIKTNIFRLFIFYLVCLSLEWFYGFHPFSKHRCWALCTAACFGRSVLVFFSPVCCSYCQTRVAAVSRTLSRWCASRREPRAGCLCLHRAWVPLRGTPCPRHYTPDAHQVQATLYDFLAVVDIPHFPPGNGILEHQCFAGPFLFTLEN